MSSSTAKEGGGDVELHAIADEWRTAHEFVRETLRKAILRGDLTGGSRLIQADLAARLEVSTTPVREALRDLATEGLITLDRHRGGVVRELNWDDMDEIRRIRDSLDPLSIDLAVQGMTDAQLEQAESLCAEMDGVSRPGRLGRDQPQVPFPVPRRHGRAAPDGDPEGTRGGRGRLRRAGPALAPGDPAASERGAPRLCRRLPEQATSRRRARPSKATSACSIEMTDPDERRS